MSVMLGWGEGGGIGVGVGVVGNLDFQSESQL